MMTPARLREIEFKFVVADKKAFHQLVEHLRLSASVLDHGVNQTNHFFDSRTFCLRQSHFAIRLRQEGTNHILTLKAEQQPDSSEIAVLTDRIEQEAELPHETAQALLQGMDTPQQVIRRYFEDSSSAPLQFIQSACGDQALIHIGEFVNHRIRLPRVRIPVGKYWETIEFELDTSTFPNGRIDHELEIEISEHSDAAAMEAALIELFEQAGIDWYSAPSKAERFFNALAAG
ncbi:MAG: CYTH domain-containing protein [Gammaproteobacteria bacterium]